jgi:hypothetical protein
MSVRLPAPLLLLQLLVSSATPAQNLLVNPDFDSDISGWSANVAWIVGAHDAEDVDEPSSSGSVLVENSRSSGGGNGLFQCVLVSGDTLYDTSIWIRIPLGQAMTGDASLRLFWFANPTCDFADYLTDHFFPIFTPSAAWTEIQESVDAPFGAQSVRFDLGVSKDDPGGTFETKFDAVYLPEPQVWLGVLVGFAALLGLDGRRKALHR